MVHRVRRKRNLLQTEVTSRIVLTSGILSRRAYADSSCDVEACANLLRDPRVVTCTKFERFSCVGRQTSCAEMFSPSVSLSYYCPQPFRARWSIRSARSEHVHTASIGGRADVDAQAHDRLTSSIPLFTINTTVVSRTSTTPTSTSYS